MFGEVMMKAGLMGRMSVKNKKRTLNIYVKPNRDNIVDADGEEAGFLGLSCLSGGEKSKTLVFLIHSFYSFMGCPFKGLDEWDVFLDEKSRKHVEEALIDVSIKLSRSQFFFISPQNSSFSTEENLKKYGSLIKVITIKKNN